MKSFWYYGIVSLVACFISTQAINAASLNDILNRLVSSKSPTHEQTPENSPEYFDVSQQPHRSLGSKQHVKAQTIVAPLETAKAHIETKIQEEFQKTYGEDEQIVFVNWRLPHFKNSQTGHWDLSSNKKANHDHENKEIAFRIDRIEITADKSKIKSFVTYKNGKHEKRIIVRGRIDHLIDVPVLNRSVHYGDIIKSEDIQWQKISDRKSGRYLLLKEQDIIGRYPKGKYIRAGVPLHKQDLVLPVLVEKGSYVTVSYMSGKIQLSLKGKALDQGYINNTIRVLNEQSNKVVHAIVDGPAQAHMP